MYDVELQKDNIEPIAIQTRKLIINRIFYGDLAKIEDVLFFRMCREVISQIRNATRIQILHQLEEDFE